MFHEFVNVINEKFEHSKESDFDSLQDYAIFRNYKKNEVILNKAVLSKGLFFVLKGYLRVYYDVKGNEKTIFFHSKGEFVWCCNNCSFQIPSTENYQALEETVLVHFDKHKIESIFKLFPKLEHIARLSAEKGIMEYQQLIASHIILSPEERFLNLIKVNKELFQRAPQKFIASYLGISPETLSRIKKRVYSK